MKEKVTEIVHKLGPALDQLSLNIYGAPELGGEEIQACGWHTELLKAHDFTVQSPFSGVQTGFKAVYDSGKPGLTIAYLAEYDALPGIGHGCAHNLLGTVSTGSGIALRYLIDDLGGRVIVFGTPAEETNGAKVVYAENGEFNGVDIAMIAHPSNKNTKSASSLALEPVQFEFFGKTAHAASSPEKGVNALDAAVVTMTAINALREHIKSDSRVHGIVAEGGKAANIVPDYSKLQYYVRSTKKTYNQELLEKIKNCARAGALATGCQLDISKFEFTYDNLITNETLSETFNQAIFEIAGIVMGEPPKNVASLDTGQVSQICPTIHPNFDITQCCTDIVSHSRQLADATLTDFAKQQMRCVISSLVLTAVRIMKDDELYQKIRVEFENTEK